MFGLDTHLAHLSDGTTLLLVLAIAGLLGLRHASDPDHLAAVTTLVAADDDRRRVRRAGRLGLTWGLGHSTSLLVFGVPIVLYRAYLPEAVQRAAETTVGLMIVGLAVWLLVRWRRGLFRSHAHARTRGPAQAYAIGLVHGAGGSAGVGVLLLASIHGRALALGALALFAVCTAVSMALLSTGFGLTLGTRTARRSFNTLAPGLGLASAAFGVWYTLGAQGLVPYVF
jgi:High-affinity nickel-transport protein